MFIKVIKCWCNYLVGISRYQQMFIADVVVTIERIV